MPPESGAGGRTRGAQGAGDGQGGLGGPQPGPTSVKREVTRQQGERGNGEVWSVS